MAPKAAARQSGIGQHVGRSALGPIAVISLAQLFGTSLWFSANSAADGLMHDWGATAADIGWLTNSVQLGFIIGTLALSLSGVADRFRASTIFVVSSLIGALANAAFAWIAGGVGTGMGLRFVVGLALAGIYPIGMKLVVSWAPDKTGVALGILVSMLVLGTGLPHLLRALGGDFPWQWIVTASSLLALVGAALVARLGDGPNLPRRAGGVRAAGALGVFRIPRFRASALGYFGHMWELYAVWTLVPLLAVAIGVADFFPGRAYGLAFTIFAMGAAGCLIGGALSRRVGSEAVALTALATSGTALLVMTLFWQHLPPGMMLAILLLWGVSVSADSPQFSALSADASPRELVGGALAFQNAIGFTISMISIWAATALFDRVGPYALWLLVPGPILGLAGYMLTKRAARW